MSAERPILTTLAIRGYRSLRDVVVPLAPLTLITGANGSGKSSLYRAIHLLAATATGRMAAQIAAEGGLSSVYWAGPERISAAMRRGEQPIEPTVRPKPQRVEPGFASEDFGYAIALGRPLMGSSLFESDPEIEREVVWRGETLRPAAILCERRGPAASAQTEEGRKILATALEPSESMTTRIANLETTPELLALGDRLRAWRFYHHVRVDQDAPARKPQIGTRTPILAHDGGDIVAALQTIRDGGRWASARRNVRRGLSRLLDRDPRPRPVFRNGRAPARPLAPDARRRAFGWNAPLHCALGGAFDAASAEPDGLERARNQPARRPHAGAGRADRKDQRHDPNHRRQPRAPPRATPLRPMARGAFSSRKSSAKPRFEPWSPPLALAESLSATIQIDRY